MLAFTPRAAARDIETRARVGGRERGVARRPALEGRGALRRVDRRRRGPDAEALARPRARPRRPDQEAHLPHHRHARAGRTVEAPAAEPRKRCAPLPKAEGRSRSPPRGRRPRPRPRSRRPRRSRSRSALRAARRPRRPRANGTEGSSGRPPRRGHPRLEVELVHDQQGLQGRPARGHQDPRAHQPQARPRRPVGHPDPQGQAADHDRHLHGAPRDRDREVRRRGRRAPQGRSRHDAQERPHQHQRDQASRARRQARRAVDRGAAREPRSASGAR